MTNSFLYQISQLDPKIKCGYTTRGTMFSRLANGDPRFNSYWIRTIAELIETMLYWLITRFVVTSLEPLLLLPHKNDILQKRFVISTVVSSYAGLLNQAYLQNLVL